MRERVREIVEFIAATAVAVFLGVLMAVVVALVAAERVAESPAPDPPCASMKQIIGVWQDQFQEGNGTYRDSREAFVAELNRLDEQGYERARPAGAMGGVMVLMECGE